MFQGKDLLGDWTGSERPPVAQAQRATSCNQGEQRGGNAGIPPGPQVMISAGRGRVQRCGEPRGPLCPPPLKRTQ